MKGSATRSIHTAPPIPAIRLGERQGVARARYPMILAVFMRLVALAWIVQGLSHWADVLLDPTGDAFSALSGQRAAAVFFFCVLNFIAAIGLWLATPWGGVVWLVTVGAQILALLLLPGFWSHGTLLVVSDIVLVAGYLVLAWLAARDESRMSEQS